MPALLFAATLFALGQGTAPAQAVTFKRVFTPGIRSVYSVDSSIQLQHRPYGFTTFFPDDNERHYIFTTDCQSFDGQLAKILYRRPSITVTGNATVDADPTTTVEKQDWKMLLTMSAINEVVDYQDLTPKKKPEPKSADAGFVVSGSGVARQAEQYYVPFLEDLIRLAGLIGSFDGSIDLEPQFDLGPVKVGDKWTRTVGFEPQKLASKAGKTVVQRLDMTFSYKGLVTSRNKQVQRIHGDLSLDTDLGKYVNDLFNLTPETTGLKSIPTKLKMALDFDLDPKTFQTLYATVHSEGGFEIYSSQVSSAVEEEKILADTTMKLIANKPIPATKK